MLEALTYENSSASAFPALTVSSVGGVIRQIYKVAVHCVVQPGFGNAEHAWFLDVCNESQFVKLWKQRTDVCEQNSRVANGTR